MLSRNVAYIDAYLKWELLGDFRSKRRFLRLEYSDAMIIKTGRQTEIP